MRPTIIVRSGDESVKTQREAAAQRVIEAFGGALPEAKLLCFLDDRDWAEFKAGPATRGLYSPVYRLILNSAPDYVRELIRPGGSSERVFDHLLYLHGSACLDDVGMSMTLAHELHHFVQWSRARSMWAASFFLVHILIHFPIEISDALGLKMWADIPHERDARIVAKRIVGSLFAEDNVTRLIDKRIKDHVNDEDAADWGFIKSVSTSDPYDFAAATYEIYKRLRPFRRECEDVLKKVTSIDPLKDVDLARLFE